MILANGCPKSGTHALMAKLAEAGCPRIPGILKSLHRTEPLEVHATAADPEPVPLTEAAGRYGYMHGHVRHGAGLPTEVRVITMLRDPRDVLISAARWRQTTLVGAMRCFWGHPFAEVYRGFLAWVGVSEIVRYEDLPRPAGRPEAVYEGAEKDSSTLNDQPSDWRTFYGWHDPTVQREWEQIGGPELVEAAGYELAGVLA